MITLNQAIINYGENAIAIPNELNWGNERNELPSIEEVVKKVLQQEKEVYQERIRKARFVKFDEKSESEWESQKQLYLEVEEYIRNNPDKIPSWKVAGPLNYAMSLEQMKDAITNKFKEMVVSGNLMTEGQLAKKHVRENFYPPTEDSERSNLTRIWGAEFLRANLIDNTTLNAAEHFLIVDDSLSEIEVQVWHGDYPLLSVVNNAQILSQKIGGLRIAFEYKSSSKLAELGYRDFGDPGNIIKDSKGMGWVVDTEKKSFDAPELDDTSYLVNDYSKKRFQALAGDKYKEWYQTFKISVADLNLK